MVIFTTLDMYYVCSILRDWCVTLFKIFKSREGHAAKCETELEREIINDLSIVLTVLGAS